VPTTPPAASPSCHPKSARIRTSCLPGSSEDTHPVLVSHSPPSLSASAVTAHLPHAAARRGAGVDSSAIGPNDAIAAPTSPCTALPSSFWPSAFASTSDTRQTPLLHGSIAPVRTCPRHREASPQKRPRPFRVGSQLPSGRQPAPFRVGSQLPSGRQPAPFGSAASSLVHVKSAKGATRRE